MYADARNFDVLLLMTKVLVNDYNVTAPRELKLLNGKYWTTYVMVMMSHSDES